MKFRKFLEQSEPIDWKKQHELIKKGVVPSYSSVQAALTRDIEAKEKGRVVHDLPKHSGGAHDPQGIFGRLAKAKMNLPKNARQSTNIEIRESYDVPERLRAGKNDDIEWRGGGIGQPLVKLAQKLYDKLKKRKKTKIEEGGATGTWPETKPYHGTILPVKIDKYGKRSPAVPNWIRGPVKYTGDVMRGKTDPRDPKNTGKNLGMAAVAGTSAFPPMRAKMGFFAPEPAAAFHLTGFQDGDKKRKPMPKVMRAQRLQAHRELDGFKEFINEKQVNEAFTRAARKALQKKRKQHTAWDVEKDPYYMGDAARHNGADISSNPFNKGSEDYEEWLKGWREARVMKEGVLDKKVLSPARIAAKHGVSLDQIKKQLKTGIGVEHEHTSNAKAARRIALAHLGEVPDYYTKLKKYVESYELEEGYFFHGSSRKIPPRSVLRRAKEMHQASSSERIGDTDVVNDHYIETHTIGCRNAADEAQEKWWDSHWKIYDEYSKDGVSTIGGDPADGKFVTITPRKK